MSDWYQLIGQTPVKLNIDWNNPASVMQLREFNEPNGRRVAETYVFGVRVSTVFLGLDHSWGGGPPILFESMAFWPGGHGDEQARCSEWWQAEIMHAEMCAHVARLRPRLEWIGSTWREWWRDAASDLARRWREMCGIKPSELDKLLKNTEHLFPRDSGW